MRSLIDQFLKPRLEQFRQEQPQMAVELATAVLLVEVSRADFCQDEAELEAIRGALLEHFSLSGDEVDTLLQNAHDESAQLVSLQHVTRLLNEQMSQQDKVRVIELMWRVVYADGDKHHYEEHLLRQVAELLYVPHADFIRARHLAET
jgi:uncharacterized tellurite resistance protein B-like protein